MQNPKGLSPGPSVEFDSANAVKSLVTEPPSPLTSYAATLNSSWNGNGEDTHYFFEWGFATTPYEHLTAIEDGGSATGPQTHGTPLTGLIANAEYHYRVVASDNLGTSYGQELKFRTAKLPSITYGLPSDYSTTEVTVHGEIDPNEVGATTYHVEYGLDTSYGSSTPESGSIGSDGAFHAVSQQLTELVPGATYHYRIVATGPGGTFNGPDQTVTTVPSLPTVAASSVSEQTIESAKITADVAPGNGSTVVFFEYGTTEEYGAHSIPGEPLPADTSAHSVSTTLTGLIPNRTYHYRVVAINFGGSSQSEDRTFQTAGPAQIGGSSASNVTKTGATINAQIDPNLASTTYHLEYGTTLDYGSSTAESGSVGSDDSQHSISASLSGLAPGTTYHVRVVATNAAGPAVGEDVVLKTAEEPVVKPPAKCKKGFVKKHGKCVKKPHHKKKNH
jgi:phosphodiesterase/alkaline phosphatase D-like protein